MWRRTHEAREKLQAVKETHRSVRSLTPAPAFERGLLHSSTSALAARAAVKQEQLAFLADNPFYTKRFGFYVVRRSRASPIRDVAKELRLDWHTVKALE